MPRHSPYALSSLTFLLRFLKHFSLLLIFLNCSLSVLIVLNCTILSYTSFTLLYIFFNVLSLFVFSLFVIKKCGGDKETRTLDLLRARQAL